MLIIRSWPCLKCTFMRFILLYTTLSLKACTINNPSGPWQGRKKCVTFLRGWGLGGSPEKRPYNFSRDQNRYVTLP